MQVTPQQLKSLLLRTIPARLAVLITGAPGIGKTDIVGSVTSELIWEKDNLPFDLIVSHPVVSDPTDFKGLPCPNDARTEANFLPFGDLARAMNVTRPTVWFFDDMGQAPQSVQSALMQLFLARHINGKKISDLITFVGATNRRTDRAGVSGILEPVKSRFQTIVELVPTVDSFAEWAMTDGADLIPPVMVAFHRYRDGLLSAFAPTADMTNSPMPRTWANLAKLEALKLPDLIESAAFAGAVGEGAALEYKAFRKMFENLTSIDEILKDPKGVKLPSKPDQLYATCTALASRATDKTLGTIGIYAERLLHESNKGEFAVLLIRDCLRRDAKLATSNAFITLSCGPIGQLLSGTERA